MTEKRMRSRLGCLMAGLLLLGSGPVAHAQSTTVGSNLLSITPGDHDILKSSTEEDAPLPSGAAVPMPDFEIKKDEPVTMEAAEMGYDQDNAIVVARGDVEVVQGGYVLNADQITYFQRSNLVKASGNVSLLQPTGDVYFAEYIELQDGMKEGVIYNFRARLADNSVFAANEAHRVNKNVTQLKKAVYSPCKICSDGSAPFWQLKAEEVEIDEAKERVTYDNARLEMFGVPTFYTPYMRHPTPDAEAKSGFMTPEYSTNGLLGTLVKVPYYWRIAPDQDVTLTPWYTTGEGPLLEGDYRMLTDEGKYSAQFSGSFPERLDTLGNKVGGNEFRGHIYARGEEGITDFSRVGFNINRASDDTYLRRYGFSDERVLFSRAYYEAAQNRNYATIQGLSMQGLRATDDSDTTPLVLPTLEGYYETDPYDNGLTLHAFANAQSLTRELGVNQHRLSVTTGASLPHITEDGHVFTAHANLRQDIYKMENVPINGGAQQFDGSKGRIIPQAALEWRYPLVNTLGDDSMTIEPIMLAVAQPSGGNPQEISNEDNTLIELNDNNLFSLQRMPGLDTIDSGSRFAYGARAQYLFDSGQSIDALLGQNYNVDDDTPFPNSTTPGENVSDIIGRIGLDYFPVALGYRFALDRSTLATNRSEVTLGLNESWITLNAVYRSLDNNAYLRDSEEGIFNASVPITDEWSIYGGARRDLTLDQMIATNLGLLYRNECFNLILQSLRTYTRDRDVEPNTEFTLRVGFKNLGEFGDQ